MSWYPSNSSVLVYIVNSNSVFFFCSLKMSELEGTHYLMLSSVGLFSSMITIATNLPVAKSFDFSKLFMIMTIPLLSSFTQLINYHTDKLSIQSEHLLVCYTT